MTTTKDLAKLMLKVSKSNPYTGKLSKEQNLIEAIKLAELCKHFADIGETDEAMNVDSEQWIEVISELQSLKQPKPNNHTNSEIPNHIVESNKMVEDDVEKLAVEEYPIYDGDLLGIANNQKHSRIDFIKGYNKAKETLYT